MSCSGRLLCPISPSHYCWPPLVVRRFGSAGGAPPASAAAVSALRTFTLSSEAPIPADIDLQLQGVDGGIVAVPASFGPMVPPGEEGLSGALQPIDVAVPGSVRSFSSAWRCIDDDALRLRDAAPPSTTSASISHSA